ncbi:glycosyltransferase [Paraburkholderia sp. A1RI-2L]|uniref:glycosyltransferase family 4 protein n=1 Tax=Paraburkholderia sp. A1RI-2L TaxID=3028367 RepID=UPI003B7BADAC
MLVLAMFLRGVARQHVIVYLHTPYLEGYLERTMWRSIFGALIGLSSGVIVLTSYARALLDKYDLAAKANVVPNPYRVCAHYPERTGSANGEITVLTMGRLVEGKGIAETVRAMSNLPDHFRLVVAGDGELAEEIKADVEKYKLGSRVTLVGWVADQDKINLLSECSVFCLPSKVDSFGMSFVEAQCYDLPIVAFRHPPVMEVIRHGGAIYVDELGEKNLASAILEANCLNSKIVRGSGARWIDESFGIENISRILRRVVDGVAVKSC